jgi:DNA-binding response OmpR family regulator
LVKTPAVQSDLSSASQTLGAARFPRVLILDDNRDNAEAFERALTRGSDKGHLPVKFAVQIVTEPEDIYRYLNENVIDIYVIDLKLTDALTPIADKRIGAEIIRRISQSSNAGLIVYSSEPVDFQSPESLTDGADDYIAKGTDPAIIQARVIALWRRVQKIRPSLMSAFAHTNRIFEIGRWHFVVGSRELTDELGQRVKISPTEHALLSHLVTIENHEIDREHFNTHVLGREIFHDDRRLDNLISRLRSKLGDSVQIISLRSDGYRLLSVRELGK